MWTRPDANFKGEGSDDRKCPKCGGGMKLGRTCLRVYLQCGQCSGRFSLEDMREFMDDGFEEEMAFVPLDRI